MHKQENNSPKIEMILVLLGLVLWTLQLTKFSQSIGWFDYFWGLGFVT